jgi:hypothetical protein
MFASPVRLTVITGRYCDALCTREQETANTNITELLFAG